MNLSKVIFAASFFFIVLFAQAQTGSVRGFVYMEDTGEPAIFTNVYLKGTTYGTTTDDNGFFNLTKIPLL